ncbi:MAG: hypothetical protein AB7K36_01195 [Chloroflexota bacterium]
MSFSSTLTRLFRSVTFTRRAASAISTADIVREDIDRRARGRRHARIDFLCRGNNLTDASRARLEAFYDQVEALHGPHEALVQTRNLAAKLPARKRPPTDPWEPTPPAAAA